eukprot:6472158-Amphidinium_carterae.1
MLALLQQSLLIDMILEETRDDFILTGEAAIAFRSAIHSYNLLSTELRLAFGEEPLFHYTIKQHCLSHIAEDSTELHPRGSSLKTLEIVSSLAHKVELVLLTRILHATCENAEGACKVSPWIGAQLVPSSSAVHLKKCIHDTLPVHKQMETPYRLIK